MISNSDKNRLARSAVMNSLDEHDARYREKTWQRGELGPDVGLTSTHQ